jgi:hypothetical protein
MPDNNLSPNWRRNYRIIHRYCIGGDIGGTIRTDVRPAFLNMRITSIKPFIKHRLVEGLETSLDDLRVFCRKTPEVYRLLLAESAGVGHRGSTRRARMR